MVVTIYALVDEAGEPRYVGQTTKPLAQRLAQHRSVARARDRPLDKWLCDCPVASIVVLEHDPADPDQAERRWIATLRACPWIDLLNVYDGGRRAPTGGTHTPEIRARISAAHRGKTLSPEHREKLSVAHAGVPLGESHRAAIGKGGRGLKRSADSRARLSASKMGSRNPMSAENRRRRAQGGDA